MAGAVAEAVAGAVAGAVAEAVAEAVAGEAAATAAVEAAWLIHGLTMATVAVATGQTMGVTSVGLAVVETGEGHHSGCAAMAGEEVVAASVVQSVQSAPPTRQHGPAPCPACSRAASHHEPRRPQAFSTRRPRCPASPA